VRSSITLLLKRLNLRQSEQVNAFLFPHNYVVATAVNGESGLDADKTIATRLVRMRFDFEPADHAPTMQLLFVVPHLFHVIARLVGKIALDHQLAGEVVVPGKGSVTASRTGVLTRILV
jgi:hypothetical protein